MKQILDTNKETNDVFIAVKTSLQSIGKLKKEDIEAKKLEGSFRYGLQSVKLIVKLISRDSGTSIEVEGLSDDVWDKGGKKLLKN